MKPMQSKPKVAIYARYSSNVQDPASIADQVVLCRRLIEREFGIDPSGLAVFTDTALTGATMKRPGLEALLKAAARKEFAVVVAEGLDRISRSLKDIAEIYERLAHHGVVMHTAHEGAVSQLHVGFKGTMNAMFLSDLKEKVRLAQRARAEEGRHPSGLAYGYRVVRGEVDEKGRTVNGLREVDPEKSKVVRRIFEEFAAGKHIKAIIRGLNDEGIVSPGGGLWRPSTIKGPATRAEGMLRNEIYRGVLVYNRTRLVTDPVTKGRQFKLNPESEWTRTSVPHLRIVDDDLWERTRIRLKERPGRPPRAPVARRAKPPHNIQPLTGLIRCGRCGGLANVADRRRYVCADARFTKACKNTRGVSIAALTGRVFRDLREALRDEPDLLCAVTALVARDRQKQDELKRARANLNSRIGRLLKLVEHGLVTDRAFERMRKLETELAKAEDALRTVPPPPASEREVRREIVLGLGRMEDEFNEKPRIPFLREAFKLVIERVTLTPLADKKRGSTIDVSVRREGWPALWLLLTEAKREARPRGS